MLMWNDKKEEKKTKLGLQYSMLRRPYLIQGGEFIYGEHPFVKVDPRYKNRNN